MAFPDPFLVKNSAATDVQFTRRNPIPNGNLYVSTAATPSMAESIALRSIITPRLLPKGGSLGRDPLMRNIISFSFAVTDSDDIKHENVLSLSLARPQVADITDTYVNECKAHLADFLVRDTGAYWTRFMRGEI